MDRFPWPQPLPGRDVRLPLVNPARKRFRTAGWMGGLGIFCMALGPVRGDRGEFGAMIGLCGFALFILACFNLMVGLRHAFRRDLLLTLDRDGMSVPRVLNFLAGTRRAGWNDIHDASLATRDGVLTGLIDGGGVKLTLGQDLLPPDWSVTEVIWRVQVRLQLARNGGHPDPLQAAAMEALGIYGKAAEGAVIALEKEGPNVLDLVASPDEYLTHVAGYPPNHRVVVGTEVATAWKAKVQQNLVELELPIPPRST